MAWGPGNPRTTTTQWRQLRRQVLARDPMCTVCHAAYSRDVHHLVSHHDGGPATLWNCVGICTPCHKRITAQQAARARWPQPRRRPEPQHPGRVPPSTDPDRHGG